MKTKTIIMMENKQDPAQHSHTQGDSDQKKKSHTQGDAANPSGGKDKNSSCVIANERTHEQHLQTNEQNKKLLQKLRGTSWDTILVISCVIAVSVDPLFFYLPIINEEIKCLGVDKNLRTAALLLRAITDIAFVLNIFYQIKDVIENVQSRAKSINSNSKNNGEGKQVPQSKQDARIRFAKIARKMPWLSITIDILAVLPIPQVLVAGFFKMRSSKYLGRGKIINVFLIAQYLPRIYRMHHSSMKLKQKKGPWIRGALYFFLYILASHVLGAFWYFFSIQRETSCWHRACMNHSTSECNFYCNEDISFRNMTFISSLDEFCLVDVPANVTAPFDFGIFLDSLKSGNIGQINFAKKFFYSFWWGLRNLSNFGTNLETSTYVLENCFAILISIVGLLLFLYLIGNVQTFISLETEKSEERRKKLRSTEMDIEVWMERNGLNKEIKNEINKIVKKKSEKIKDADMENVFYILPKATRISLKRALCMEILKKVPLRLKAMEKKPDQENKETIQEKVLTSICDSLKPVMYPDNSFVFRMGEPLDRMLLITEGLVWAYNTTSSSISQGGEAGIGAICLGKGAYYGDELVSWASARLLDSLENVPMLKANVKCHTKIEGFVLTAKDLNAIVHKYKFFWDFSDSQIRKLAAIQTIQKAARQLTLRSKKDKKKVLQPDSPPDSLVVDVPSEDATTASSQVP
ncbi:putative potassium channel, voltage-dependent, ELK [Rosa chinensis]|uniref:Putative potassium channel, voltage-dependent, ELK n=1 Tax=Rosa chinensis TaxID=74649 RepID=A0A2P6RS78_ROSCH|nr:cyclic nucleotide-gated ion channel 1 [Rosa chinensis]PRQ49288.1 putative potassium channel, voltage-dependent, ELK [Rosa chinensis]